MFETEFGHTFFNFILSPFAVWDGLFLLNPLEFILF